MGTFKKFGKLRLSWSQLTVTVSKLSCPLQPTRRKKAENWDGYVVAEVSWVWERTGCNTEKELRLKMSNQNKSKKVSGKKWFEWFQRNFVKSSTTKCNIYSTVWGKSQDKGQEILEANYVCTTYVSDSYFLQKKNKNCPYDFYHAQWLIEVSYKYFFKFSKKPPKNLTNFCPRI